MYTHFLLLKFKRFANIYKIFWLWNWTSFTGSLILETDHIAVNFLGFNVLRTGSQATCIQKVSLLERRHRLSLRSWVQYSYGNTNDTINLSSIQMQMRMHLPMHSKPTYSLRKWNVIMYVKATVSLTLVSNNLHRRHFLYVIPMGWKKNELLLNVNLK